MRPVILIIAYPFVTHLAIIFNNPVPVFILLAVILAWVISTTNFKNSLYKWIGLTIIGLSLAVLLASTPNEFALLYLPPVVLNMFLLILFGRTLLAGETALISRFAMLQYGELSPAMIRYTRNVTIVWSLFFFVMILETILLTIFASLETWSLYTNFYNYLFMSALFVIEYKVRVIRFKDLPHTGFVDFIRRLTKTNLRQLQR